MVLVKKVRSRGANMVIEANGEVLFGPDGVVRSWTRSFSNKINGAVTQAAPTNKRPRWAHYGRPLKRTFKASSRADALKMRAYAAVGSSAPHAAFVDQGTGVYAGRSPWEAAILPPTRHGGANLYERSWVPPGSGKAVGKVIIKGQKPQQFFDRGLRAAFAAVRMATVYVPGTPPALSNVESEVAPMLGGLLNGPVSTPAFIAQLKEWRAWRDLAWRNNREFNGSGTYISRNASGRYSKPRRPRTTSSERRAQERAASKRYRDTNKATINAIRRRQRAQTANQARKVDAAKAKHLASQTKFLTRIINKYPAADGYQIVGRPVFVNGAWEVAIKTPSGKVGVVRG